MMLDRAESGMTALDAEGFKVERGSHLLAPLDSPLLLHRSVAISFSPLQSSS